MNQTNNRFPTRWEQKLCLPLCVSRKTEVMVQKDRYIRFDWAVKVRHEVLMLIV